MSASKSSWVIEPNCEIDEFSALSLIRNAKISINSWRSGNLDRSAALRAICRLRTTSVAAFLTILSNLGKGNFDVCPYPQAGALKGLTAVAAIASETQPCSSRRLVLCFVHGAWLGQVPSDLTCRRVAENLNAMNSFSLSDRAHIIGS